MSSNSLHQLVLDRFKRALGEPHNALGTDYHWGLRPRPDMASINVLLNGKVQEPALWVFDPHVPNDGVMRSIIKGPDEVERLIAAILQRVENAASLRG